MIIVEGPDLAGKSTLCEALFRRAQTHSSFDPMVRHFTKVSPRFHKFWGYKSCIQRDVILDRFHLSHVIYRYVQEESHDLSPFNYELVDAEISRVGGIVVILNPSPDLIAWRYYAKDRDEMYSLDQIQSVAQQFRSVSNSGTITTQTGFYTPKIDMSISFSSDLDVTKAADQILGMWELRQTQLDLLIAQRPGTL